MLAAAWAVRHRLLRTHTFLFFLLVIAGAVYLALPRTVFATYMADQRMPVAHRLHGHCVHPDRPAAPPRPAGFAVMLVLLVAVRVTEVQMVWNNLTQWTVAFHDSIAKIKRGSKVLVAYADPWGGSAATDLGLVHAACLAIIERSSLVTTAFTVPGKQILRVHKPYTDWVDTEDGTPPSVEQLL